MSRRSSLRRRSVLGAVSGAVVAGVAGCLSGGGDDDTTTTGGGNAVAVGPDGNYEFAPDSLTVAVGDELTWTWASPNHNIVVDSQPEAADWSGTAGGPSDTYDADYEYSHTFETAGTYEYYCSPHEGLGMRAEVVVEADGG